jgi:hypothetical protein
MKAVLGQQHFDMSYCQSSIPDSLATGSRFAAVLSAGLAAVSLLGATPAFGQTATTVISSEKQNLTCVMKGQDLVCDVQQLGEAPKTITFEQTFSSEGTNEAIELASVTRTALLNPDLDEMISNILIWAVYLGLPLTMVVAIWSHDQRAREQMVKLVQHITALERIWQHPPTR